MKVFGNPIAAAVGYSDMAVTNLCVWGGKGEGESGAIQYTQKKARIESWRVSVKIGRLCVWPTFRTATLLPHSNYVTRENVLLARRTTRVTRAHANLSEGVTFALCHLKRSVSESFSLPLTPPPKIKTIIDGSRSG